VYLEDVLDRIAIERRRGCGFGEECEKGFPTNLPTNGLKQGKTTREKIIQKSLWNRGLTACRDTSGHRVK
jgi:hypothetical protein